MYNNLTYQNYKITTIPIRRNFVKIELMEVPTFSRKNSASVLTNIQGKKIIAEVSGQAISGSVTFDASNTMRRSCNLTMVVTDDTLSVSSKSYIWLNKKMRVFIGMYDNETQSIIWNNTGEYLINNPSYSYNANSRVLTLSGLDLMAKLTGARGGTLAGEEYVIEAGSSIKEAMIAALHEAGIDKYIIEENETTKLVPAEIRIPVGSTYDNLIQKLAIIEDFHETFFDVDGVFVYQKLPVDDTEVAVVGDELLVSPGRMIISEGVSVNFEDVKNSIEVIGKSHDVSYFVPQNSVTLNLGRGPSPDPDDDIWDIATNYLYGDRVKWRVTSDFPFRYFKKTNNAIDHYEPYYLAESYPTWATLSESWNSLINYDKYYLVDMSNIVEFVFELTSYDVAGTILDKAVFKERWDIFSNTFSETKTSGEYSFERVGTVWKLSINGILQTAQTYTLAQLSTTWGIEYSGTPVEGDIILITLNLDSEVNSPVITYNEIVDNYGVSQGAVFNIYWQDVTNIYFLNMISSQTKTFRGDGETLEFYPIPISSTNIEASVLGQTIPYTSSDFLFSHDCVIFVKGDVVDIEITKQSLFGERLETLDPFSEYYLHGNAYGRILDSENYMRNNIYMLTDENGEPYLKGDSVNQFKLYLQRQEVRQNEDSVYYFYYYPISFYFTDSTRLYSEIVPSETNLYIHWEGISKKIIFSVAPPAPIDDTDNIVVDYYNSLVDTTLAQTIGFSLASASMVAPSIAGFTGTIDAFILKGKVGNISGAYVFTYNSSNWMYAGNIVTLLDYGIVITAGSPTNGNTLTANLTAEVSEIEQSFDHFPNKILSLVVDREAEGFFIPISGGEYRDSNIVTTIITTVSLGEVSLNVFQFQTSIPSAMGEYLFTYNADHWELNALEVVLADYGITLTGTAINNDTITAYIWSKTVFQDLLILDIPANRVIFKDAIMVNTLLEFPPTPYADMVVHVYADDTYWWYSGRFNSWVRDIDAEHIPIEGETPDYVRMTTTFMDPPAPGTVYHFNGISYDIVGYDNSYKYFIDGDIVTINYDYYANFLYLPPMEKMGFITPSYQGEDIIDAKISINNGVPLDLKDSNNEKATVPVKDISEDNKYGDYFIFENKITVLLDNDADRDADYDVFECVDNKFRYEPLFFKEWYPDKKITIKTPFLSVVAKDTDATKYFILDPSATIESTVTSYTAEIDAMVFAERVGRNSGIYVFTYNGAWYYNIAQISLSDYGVTFTGSPSSGDTITIILDSSYSIPAWGESLFILFDANGYFIRQASEPTTYLNLPIKSVDQFNMQTAYNTFEDGVFYKIIMPSINYAPGISINSFNSVKIVLATGTAGDNYTETTYFLNRANKAYSFNTGNSLYFIGEQQPRAILKDEDENSPFNINLNGELRQVLSGGEYDNIYTTDLAEQRAKYELWLKTRLNEQLSLDVVPILWADVNAKINHPQIKFSKPEYVNSVATATDLLNLTGVALEDIYHVNDEDLNYVCYSLDENDDIFPTIAASWRVQDNQYIIKSINYELKSLTSMSVSAIKFYENYLDDQLASPFIRIVGDVIFWDMVDTTNKACNIYVVVNGEQNYVDTVDAGVVGQNYTLDFAGNDTLASLLGKYPDANYYYFVANFVYDNEQSEEDTVWRPSNYSNMVSYLVLPPTVVEAEELIWPTPDSEIKIAIGDSVVVRYRFTPSPYFPYLSDALYDDQAAYVELDRVSIVGEDGLLHYYYCIDSGTGFSPLTEPDYWTEVEELRYFSAIGNVLTLSSECDAARVDNEGNFVIIEVATSQEAYETKPEDTKEFSVYILPDVAEFRNTFLDKLL